MFIINNHTMEAFAARQEAEYVDRVIGFLQEQFKNAASKDPASLRQPVQEQITRGKAYGLETEYQGCIYVTTAWILGTDFDQSHPAAADVLSRSDLTPDQKTQWLQDYTQAMLDTLVEANP